MLEKRTVIQGNLEVRSLCWRGDKLVDWVAGGIEYGLDGSVTDPCVNWGDRFDSAVQSPSGRYACIYEKLGTKGVLLENGKFLREIDRSYYQDEAYEFPIVFFSLDDGREVLAHCPDVYCRLEIEDVESGERLTRAEKRRPDDFFHSRLDVSPNGKWLLSAGWLWHPFNTVCVFDIKEALDRPASLNSASTPYLGPRGEINSAAFTANNFLIVACSPDSEYFGDDQKGGIKPGHTGVVDLNRGSIESIVPVHEIVGTMYPVGLHFLIGFYENPKLIDLRSGAIVHRWGDLATGQQNSSILWHHDLPPPIAYDRHHSRFAVADGAKVNVIEVQNFSLFP